MNARLVSKCIFSYNGFVALHEEPSETADQLTARLNVARFDICLHRAEKIFSCSNSHDDFFHRRVACAFADAINGALYLPGTCLHRCQGI